VKKWTQHQASNGLAVNPPLVNDELTAQQSSATTLDRAQLPASWVDAARLKDGALHQAWEASLFPAGGEQTTEVDAIVPPMGWMSSTLQIQSGGWTSISPSPILLTGFRGGNLFLEWSCNAWVNNIFIHGLNDGKPYSPNYMRLRAVVNGTVIGERRGAGYHQTSRLVASAQLPAGDLSVELQYRLTSASEDWASTVTPGTGGYHVPYGHLYSNRYLIIGRFR
jgi:hypothetical protein